MLCVVDVSAELFYQRVCGPIRAGKLSGLSIASLLCALISPVT